VAKQLGISEGEAILLAAECSDANYVWLDVKGPPYRQLPGSAILTEAGRQLLKSRTSTALRDDQETSREGSGRPVAPNTASRSS